MIATTTKMETVIVGTTTKGIDTSQSAPVQAPLQVEQVPVPP